MGSSAQLHLIAPQQWAFGPLRPPSESDERRGTSFLESKTHMHTIFHSFLGALGVFNLIHGVACGGMACEAPVTWPLPASSAHLDLSH